MTDIDLVKLIQKCDALYVMAFEDRGAPKDFIDYWAALDELEAAVTAEELVERKDELELLADRMEQSA